MLTTTVGLSADWLWASCRQDRRRMTRTWGTLKYFHSLGTLPHLREQSWQKYWASTIWTLFSLGWVKFYVEIALALGYWRAWGGHQRRLYNLAQGSNNGKKIVRLCFGRAFYSSCFWCDFYPLNCFKWTLNLAYDKVQHLQSCVHRCPFCAYKNGIE